ncbi:hypothetical protein EG832_20685, partial [bacterium]|nr:hypothetical protein [bacterium]
MTVDPLLPVSVSISVSANPICAGSSVTFTASPTNGGTTPSYQWRINGIDQGINNPTFNYTPAEGDNVTVILTSSETCTVSNPITSEPITVAYFDPLLPGSINTTTSQFCLGGTEAIGGNPPTYSHASGGSGNFTYTWQIDVGCNGTWVDIPGTDNASFTPDPHTILGSTCYRRLVTDDVCATEVSTSEKRFEIYPELVSQNIEPSPSSLTVCEGTPISATFTGGSGGFVGAYTDLYDYSTNSGIVWNPYSPGQEMSTTGLSGVNVFQIRTQRRATSVDGCDWGDPVIVSWSVTALPDPPTGAASQAFCATDIPTVSNLSATGTDIQWYDAPSGGSPLP